MQPPAIFDRNARRLRRDRAQGFSFLAGQMVDGLLERLDAVSRRFVDALVIGAESTLIAALRERGLAVTVTDPAPGRAALANGIQAEEDRLPFGEAAFDIVVAAGTLDTVDDLPGALILIRRALRPDGLMLASFFGAPSLPALRRAAAAADGGGVQRVHPQIDARGAGDLLVRAGFALPVADVDTLDLAYGDLGGLVADLRAAAATNALAERRAVTRGWLREAAAAFAAMARADGRVRESISFVTMTGWAPAPGQPKPARRGSATTSLAAALRKSN